MAKHTHHDCGNYIHIDVFKGLCRRHKETRMADEDCCADFQPVKKCKFCIHYTAREEFLGMCMDRTEVYPDLIAKTCNDFEWNEEFGG